MFVSINKFSPSLSLVFLSQYNHIYNFFATAFALFFLYLVMSIFSIITIIYYIFCCYSSLLCLSIFYILLYYINLVLQLYWSHNKLLYFQQYSFNKACFFFLIKLKQILLFGKNCTFGVCLKKISLLSLKFFFQICTIVVVKGLMF